MDAFTRAYDRRLTQSVQRALACGARKLPDVLVHTPGVFPLTVMQKLREFGAHISPIVKIPKAVVHTPRIRHPPFVLPHPLDYDWRFGREALRTLSDLLRDTQSSPAPVYCFGCPSVASFLRRETWHAGVHLYDCNGALHEEGRPAWQVEVLTELKLPVGSVVVDPPWYPRHFRHFLWAIQKACAVGTYVFVAGPPVGTRPGVAAEMSRVWRWARRLGFEVRSHRPLALPYVAPLFELNTLAAYGAHDVSLTWRRADLWQLRLGAKPNVPQPEEILTDGEWTEHRFGSVRVRIRTDLPGRGWSNLQPLGEGGFLGSVSSRDPHRREARVVTSGGRFFACANPKALLRMIESGSGIDHKNTPETIRSRRVKWDLPQLIAVEQMEAARYYDLVRKLDGI